MPLTRRSLALPADPGSARLARAWVAQILTAIERDDLVFAAELGVSELVTNAILHGSPPVTVRIRGTREFPRVEVADHSPDPLRVTSLPESDDEDDLLITYGRGLALVAMNSTHWGWSRDADGIGKAAWFEPAAETNEQVDLHAMVETDDHPVDPEPAEPPPDAITIRLLQTPAELFGQLRRYHADLRRELRLLALAAPDRYPLAVQATEVFATADGERRAAVGVRTLDEAIEAGLPSVDLQYAVPPSTPRTMGTLLDLFAQLRESFADEELLAVTPRPELLRLQRWYFGEFVRQGAGRTPTPWPGFGDGSAPPSLAHGDESGR